MAKHSHDWVTQMYVFPEEGGDYEHDEPYVVEYCTDRQCGQRRTKEISSEVVAEVRAANGFPAEEIRNSEEGGDE